MLEKNYKSKQKVIIKCLPTMPPINNLLAIN